MATERRRGHVVIRTVLCLALFKPTHESTRLDTTGPNHLYGSFFESHPSEARTIREHWCKFVDKRKELSAVSNLHRPFKPLRQNYSWRVLMA